MSDREFSIQNIVLGSHLWLGLCAAMFTWGSFVLLQQPVSFIYLGFVFAGTMTIYSFHAAVNLNRNNRKSKNSDSLPSFMTGLMWAGCTATVIFYLFLTRSYQVILLLPIGMAILYVFPVYHGKRLKDYPFIKIIAIVISWTTITFWIPVHSISHWWEELAYDYLFIDRLLFFFALAIPFDIRDIQFDKANALKTIPNTIGLDNSQYLALLSLFLAGGFLTMGIELLDVTPSVKIGLLAVYILLGILIIRLKNLPEPRFYSWFIDGILFLYGLVILFLSK